jgi:hypothetical protein
MDQQTAKVLKELHLELRRMGPVSASDRELVEQLQDDVKALLVDSSDVSSTVHHSLVGRLQDATQRFEVSHPDLTAVIARVVDALSNLGI